MVLPPKIWYLASILVQASFSNCLSFAKNNNTQSFAHNLLHESMNWLDMYYDTDAGYLYSLSAQALTHETRASAWYASGLLARNEGDDVEQALKIIRNVIGGQHKNVSSQWYVFLAYKPEWSRFRRRKIPVEEPLSVN